MAKAPHFGGELFSIDSGTFAGVMPNSEQLAAMDTVKSYAQIRLQSLAE